MVAAPPRPNLVRMSVALVAVVAAIGGYSMLPVEAQSTSALPFARSFLLTGNYAVVGVDLLPQAADCATFAPDCYAKGDIQVNVCPSTGAQPGSCIPAGADVVAAFMYWEAISLDPTTMPPARFLGQTVTNAKRSDRDLPSEASCLSAGGALKLSMFSADVLRFFPLQKDVNLQSTGRRIVTGTHQVALPEVGNGNQARQGAGASILFVYRTADDPLRKVVVYDGVYLQTPLGTVTSQTLQGFYQSGTDPQSAWLTHIVGSGSKNETERLKFNASVVTEATDPFKFPLGNQGGNGSDRAWSNPTYDVSGKMQQATSPVSGFGETATTEVDHTNNTPYECLSWAAVIFSTAVKDVDRDGLPDGLEDATTTLKDPDPINSAGRDLPRLRAMGANKGSATSQKDVFIEMNGMWTPPASSTTPATSYGDATAPFSTILDIDTVTDSAGHNHLPTPAVIKLLGDALKSAPTSIALHVDVGDIGDYKALGPDYKVNDADEYLVPSAEARGGELIRETPCVATQQTTDPTVANSIGCHFPKFPGTVGWKFGFQHYRDQAVDGEDGHELIATAQSNPEAECYLDGTYGNGPGNACRRRFDPIRADLFHYFLYAHAMGIPKGNPCLNASGVDVPYPVSTTASCGSLANNPDFHVPKSFSGVADFPGGGALITLGLWDMTKFVGSTFLQASTTMHELGHNWELSHAGKPPVFGNSTTATVYEANCKPNYPSIMSYLFQVNGLLDAAGNPHIDYARKAYYDLANGTTNKVLNESALYDGNQTGTAGLPLPDASLDAAFQYRTAWFVPITSGSVAEAIGIQPAGRYCGGEAFATAPSTSMGRFDGPSLASAIDWKLDGISSPSSSDANFDGAITAAYAGYDDWSSVRLDRLGGSKNPEGYSLGQGGFGYGQGGFGFGPGNFDFGQGGFGYGQGGFGFGQGGFGFGVGGFQLGDGAFGFGQGGFGFGQGGFGFGQGGFGFGQGGFGFGSDPDFDHVKKMGNLPPLSAKVCIIGGTTPALSCPSGTQGSLHRNRVTWAPPNAGKVLSYRVYRALGSSISSTNVEQLCGDSPLPACPTGTIFVDAEELPNGQNFTYFVRAFFKECNPATSTCLPDDCNPTLQTCASGPSNFVTLPAENTPPVAVNDPQQGVTYSTTPGATLIIPAPGVLGSATQNDFDTDSPKTRIRVFDYTQPATGSVVVDADGGFTFTASSGSPGTVTFTYRTDDGVWRTTNPILMSNPSNSAMVTITVGSKKK
jgi:hypothetical protein